MVASLLTWLTEPTISLDVRAVTELFALAMSAVAGIVTLRNATRMAQVQSLQNAFGAMDVAFKAIQAENKDLKAEVQSLRDCSDSCQRALERALTQLGSKINENTALKVQLKQVMEGERHG